MPYPLAELAYQDVSNDVIRWVYFKDDVNDTYVSDTEYRGRDSFPRVCLHTGCTRDPSYSVISY